MKSALRKALLPALAATAVMAATPALAQNVGFSISIGSPGYQNGYGYGGYGRGYGYRGNDLQYRAAALSQHVQRLAYSGRLDHFEARNLSQTEPARAVVARNDANEREKVIPYDPPAQDAQS